ncbi:hypothetical protein [Kaistia granuli]|uniref:hypothetical protein n=1 Tax=Kaistia granuli TaxID=363259 RepID=UPI000367292C|nr:hypothetical protein [Kaistia granuli]
MDSAALAKSEADTRRALYHIAYGPPLRLSWRDQFTFAYRDLKREWHGQSPSNYPGRFIRMLSDHHGAPPGFIAGRFMKAYLRALILIPDIAFRAGAIVRKRAMFNRGVAATRAGARRKIETDGERALGQ